MHRHTHFLVLISGALAALVLDLPIIAAALVVIYFALDLALEGRRHRMRGRS